MNPQLVNEQGPVRVELIVADSRGKHDQGARVRGICQYFYVMNADGSGLHAVRTGVANTFLTDWGPAR